MRLESIATVIALSNVPICFFRVAYSGDARLDGRQLNSVQY